MKSLQNENNQKPALNLSFQDRRFLRKQLRRSKKHPYFTVPSEALMNAPMIKLHREPDGLGSTKYSKDNATLNIPRTKEYLRKYSKARLSSIIGTIIASLGIIYKVILDWKDEIYDFVYSLLSKPGN